MPKFQACGFGPIRPEKMTKTDVMLEVEVDLSWVIHLSQGNQSFDLLGLYLTYSFFEGCGYDRKHFKCAYEQDPHRAASRTAMMLFNGS